MHQSNPLVWILTPKNDRAWIILNGYRAMQGKPLGWFEQSRWDNSYWLLFSFCGRWRSTFPNCIKYIGALLDTTDQLNDLDGTVLQRLKQAALPEYKYIIGWKQVRIGSLEFAPGWFLNDAIQYEMPINWKGAYEKVMVVAVSHGAYLISFHVYF